MEASQQAISDGASKQAMDAGSEKKGDTVVIAMDGSEYSDYALQSVGMLSGDSMMSMVTHEMDEEEKKTNELTERLTQRMHNLKVNGTIERVHGVPGPAIVSLAADRHAAFIVVGCRGKGSVRRTFTGSVTDYIMHHADVPVIVARHKDHMEQHHGFHIHNPFHKKHEDQPSS